jgi:GNAT superfamily N-acetyltransferase
MAIDTELVESEAVGELCGFYVHPDSLGTGVANELHNDALDRLPAGRWATLKLWVLTDNARARRFY